MASPLPPASKRVVVRDGLTELAERVGPGGKLPTLRELMAQLQASQTTVVAAIGDLEACGLLRRRHGSGIYVVGRNGTGEVVVLCDPILLGEVSQFYGRIIQTAMRTLAAASIKVSIELLRPRFAPTDPDHGVAELPETLIPRINSGQISTLVAVLVTDPTIELIQALGCPVVSLFSPGDYIVHLATLDTINSGVEALDRLDCRHVHALGLRLRDEVEVFRSAARMRNIQRADADVMAMGIEDLLWNASLPDRATEGFREAQALFGPGTDPSTWPDGVLSLNDQLSAGFLAGLHRLGLAPGRDFHIATVHHKHTSPLMAWSDSIVSLEYDPAEIGEMLAQAVVDVREGTEPTERGWERAVRVQHKRNMSRDLAVMSHVVIPPGLTRLPRR